MMPTKENGYANYLMPLGLIFGCLIGTIIGIFLSQLLWGTLVGTIGGYALGVLIYFLAVKKEMNNQK